MTEADVAILDFEARWWAHRGSKEQAIADLFGLGTVAYYQRLNRLIDDPAALQARPMVVKRLARLRQRRISLGR